MNRYYYDLHIHSCLSPCGDNDNTPNNIAGMASLCGLNIVALTDHNTCKNCSAFFKAAEKYQIIPIAGMELTTSEDIHVVCLFENLSDALSFDQFIEEKRVLIRNRKEIFGEQLVLNENDEIVSEIEHLLTNATSISIEDVVETVSKFNGICYPAHIDRSANGIVEILGTIPVDNDFIFYEIHDKSKIAEFSKKFDIPKDRFIVSSDAHYLTDMRDKENFFEIDEPFSDVKIRARLFDILRGKNEGTVTEHT